MGTQDHRTEDTQGIESLVGVSPHRFSYVDGEGIGENATRGAVSPSLSNSPTTDTDAESLQPDHVRIAYKAFIRLTGATVSTTVVSSDVWEDVAYQVMLTCCSSTMTAVVSPEAARSLVGRGSDEGIVSDWKTHDDSEKERERQTQVDALDADAAWQRFHARRVLEHVF